MHSLFVFLAYLSVSWFLVPTATSLQLLPIVIELGTSSLWVTYMNTVHKSLVRQRAPSLLRTTALAPYVWPSIAFPGRSSCLLYTTHGVSQECSLFLKREIKLGSKFPRSHIDPNSNGHFGEWAFVMSCTHVLRKQLNSCEFVTVVHGLWLTNRQVIV